MKQTKFNCPVEATLSLIGGKYKPLILWHLVGQPLHYMELQRKIPGATPKMLSQHLHELEGCGMVHREVIPEKPPNPDKPEKFILYFSPLCYSKEKGGFHHVTYR